MKKYTIILLLILCRVGFSQEKSYKEDDNVIFYKTSDSCDFDFVCDKDYYKKSYTTYTKSFLEFTGNTSAIRKFCYDINKLLKFDTIQLTKDFFVKYANQICATKRYKLHTVIIKKAKNPFLEFVIEIKDTSKIENVSKGADEIIEKSQLVQKAYFPGGGDDAMLQYVAKNINWPECCYAEKKSGVTGKVYANFVIEKDGHISNIIVIKYPLGGEKLAEEVVRVVNSMPNWENAELNDDVPARMWFTIPVNFKVTK